MMKVEGRVEGKQKARKGEDFIGFGTAETHVGREAFYNQQNPKRETRSTNHGKQGMQRVHTFLN